MVEARRAVSALPMDLDGVQARHALFARYEGVDDPVTFVDTGLALESVVCADEMHLSVGQPSEGLSVALGSLFRYASEKARQEGLALSGLFSTEVVTLDDLQAFAVADRDKLADYGIPPTLPLFGEGDNMINDELEPWDILNLITLRVIDVHSREVRELWLGTEAETAEPGRVIQDLVAYIALTADRYRLQLSDIYTQTIDRLSTQVPQARAAEVEATLPRKDRILGLGRAL